MKKLIFIIIMIGLLAAYAAGCASQVTSSNAVSLSPVTGSSSPSPTESISFQPIPTTPPDSSPTPDPGKPADDDETMAVTVGGWTYYLDVNDPIATDYNEDPPLHKKMPDGSQDQKLGIRGFQFDIIGNYIYIDSNDPDLSAAGDQTWTTTRISLDGSNKKELEYGCMTRLIPEGDQKFYFTTLGDSAIYISDLSCENVTTLAVALPNESKLDSKLDKSKILQINITGVASGVINFDAIYLSTNGTMLYSGSYTINADGTNIALVPKSDKIYNYAPQND